MAYDSDSFDFELFSSFEEYDPLADPKEDVCDEETTPVPINEQPDANDAPTQTDKCSAATSIDKLFDAMKPNRRTLLGLLSFCETPRTNTEVAGKVDELQAHNYSVYNAANYCALLEQAGALVRALENGTPMKSVKQEPEHVFIDDVEYLKPRKTPPVYWLATEAGVDKVRSNVPFDRLRKTFEKEQRYLPIYHRILSMCTTDSGRTAKELGDAVNNDPIVQKPHMYALRFIYELEKCEALVWDGSWKTTETGYKGLAELFGDGTNATESKPDSSATSEE